MKALTEVLMGRTHTYTIKWLLDTREAGRSCIHRGI